MHELLDILMCHFHVIFGFLIDFTDYCFMQQLLNERIVIASTETIIWIISFYFVVVAIHNGVTSQNILVVR